MKKLIGSLMIIYALLAGCSKESENVTNKELKELGVSARITVTANTRSLVDGGGFVADQSVGVFITGTGTSAYISKVAAYTYNGSSWASPANSGDKIWLSDVIAKVYGFYPSDAVVTDGIVNDNATLDISLLASENSLNAAGLIDYMYAVPVEGVSNATGAEKVNLNFKHALSKLTFVINKGESYVGLGSLASLKLTGSENSFNSGSGTMKIADGTLNWSTQTGALTFTGAGYINEYNETPSASPVVTELVAPRADNSATTLTLTIDGKEMSTTLPEDASSWLAGKNYTYTVTVNGTNMAVNNVSITQYDNLTGGVGNVQ